MWNSRPRLFRGRRGRLPNIALLSPEFFRKKEKIHQVAEHVADSDVDFLDPGGIPGRHGQGQIGGGGHRPAVAAA